MDCSFSENGFLYLSAYAPEKILKVDTATGIITDYNAEYNMQCEPALPLFILNGDIISFECHGSIPGIVFIENKEPHRLKSIVTGRRTTLQEYDEVKNMLYVINDFDNTWTAIDIKTLFND